MSTRSWADLRKQGEDASKPLPDGWYNVQVVKADATEASTGSPMIKTQLRVTDGPHATRVLFTQFVLSVESPFALSIFFKNMGALGLNDAFFDNLMGAESDPKVGMVTVAANMIGRTARAEVGSRTWQGREMNEVKSLAEGEFNPGMPKNNGGSVVSPTGIPTIPGGPQAGKNAGQSLPSVPSVPSVTIPTPATNSSENNDTPPAVPAF